MYQAYDNTRRKRTIQDHHAIQDAIQDCSNFRGEVGDEDNAMELVWRTRLRTTSEAGRTSTHRDNTISY